MKIIREIEFLDLEDYLQDQIARELVEDFDKGYDPSEFNSLRIYLYEYDPSFKEDKELLEDFLDQKISSEGEPEEEHLLFYDNNLHLLIKQPFLVINGFCGEGRHRLATSLKHNHVIRGVII